VKTEAAQIAVVFTTVGGATGALAGILASTRSTPNSTIAAQGYDKAKTDLQELAAVVPSSAVPVPETVSDVAPSSG